MFDSGVLKGKKAMLSLTTGGPGPVFVKGGFMGDIHAILRPVQRGVLRFVGYSYAAPLLPFCVLSHSLSLTLSRSLSVSL